MGVSCAHQEGLCEWWGWYFFLALLWEPAYFSLLPKKLATQWITMRFWRTAPRSTSSCHVSISHSPPPASCWWVQLRKQNLLKRDLVQVMHLSGKQLPKETYSSSEKWVLYIPKRKETLMATGWSMFNLKRLGITSHSISYLLLHIRVSLECANIALFFLILHPWLCSTHLAHYKRNKKKYAPPDPLFFLLAIPV